LEPGYEGQRIKKGEVRDGGGGRGQGKTSPTAHVVVYVGKAKKKGGYKTREKKRTQRPSTLVLYLNLGKAEVLSKQEERR